MIEIAGPERERLSELVGQFLKVDKDKREIVIRSPRAYFGVELDDRSLLPGSAPRIGAMRFDQWLSRSASQKQAVQK